MHVYISASGGTISTLLSPFLPEGGRPEEGAGERGELHDDARRTEVSGRVVGEGRGKMDGANLLNNLDDFLEGLSFGQGV